MQALFALPYKHSSSAPRPNIFSPAAASCGRLQQSIRNQPILRDPFSGAASLHPLTGNLQARGLIFHHFPERTS